MAIGPQELAELTPEDNEAVGKLEDIIDQKLETGYEPGGQVNLPVANLTNTLGRRITYKMKKELLLRYTKVGWAVSFDPTGSFLIFAGPAKPPEKEVVPDIGSDEMLARMKERAENGETPTVKPPTFNPMTRENPENPYQRSKLASKP